MVDVNMVDMAASAIFQGQEGRQIKFFIQKDLEAETVEKLQQDIIANGGRIEPKIPIQGFVLVDPNTSEGLRLIECWDTTERPLRYFVPYTFVDACSKAQRLIPQVFRRNGTSLKIHIHPSVGSEPFIETLRDSIWHSGGYPLAAEHEADVVIAEENSSSFIALLERFEHFHNRYVETASWVNQCIDSGVYEHTAVVKRNLGGRIPGNKRTEFTAADDHHLVRYIACRLPDPEMRGRTGNKLYQDLCSRLDLYPWAERHPWQSWRERYKNNATRFNSLIATYLVHNPLPDGGKGLHGYFRVSSTPVNSQPKESSVQRSGGPLEDSPQKEDRKDDDSDWGSQWDVKVANNSPPAWGKGKRKASEDRDNTRQRKIRKKKQGSQDTHSPVKMTEPASEPSGVVETLGTVSLKSILRAQAQNQSPSPPCIRATGTLPFRSSAGSGSEGNGVGEETQALLHANKQLLNSGPDSPSERSPLDASHSQTDDTKSGLTQIAREYRFLEDEVLEEYEDLNHDLDATRSHFKEMRSHINEVRSRRKQPVEQP